MKRRRRDLDELLDDAAKFYTQPNKSERELIEEVKIRHRPKPQELLPIPIFKEKSEPVPVSFRPAAYSKRPAVSDQPVASLPETDESSRDDSDDSGDDDSQSDQFCHLNHPIIIASGIKPTAPVNSEKSRGFLSNVTLGVTSGDKHLVRR